MTLSRQIDRENEQEKGKKVRDRQRQRRQTHEDRQRQWETDRDRQRQAETCRQRHVDIDRHRHRDLTIIPNNSKAHQTIHPFRLEKRHSAGDLLGERYQVVVGQFSHTQFFPNAVLVLHTSAPSQETQEIPVRRVLHKDHQVFCPITMQGINSTKSNILTNYWVKLWILFPVFPFLMPFTN